MRFKTPRLLNSHVAGGCGVVRTAAQVATLAVITLASTGSWADNLFDASVRADMLKHRDGRVAHVESEYNDIFVDKRSSYLTLYTRFKSESYIKSMINLKDPDELPGQYAQMISVGLLYPEAPRQILMVGLGAGSVSTYLGRAMAETQIDIVEIDPGVIAVAKKYFGVQETDRVHIIESDGRVYLNRHKDLYDLILLDAYRELGVPFHLLTREFYTLLKERLAPGGAVALNIAGGTKLYASTLVTLRAVFPTVDVYPVFDTREESQMIAVSTPTPAPGVETLTQRAVALQGRYQFRYQLPLLLTKRVVDRRVPGGELLTDDFAPVGLYELTPFKSRRRP